MNNFNIDRLSADIDLLNELVEKKDTRIADLKAWQVISDDEIAALQGVINKRDERIAELEEEHEDFLDDLELGKDALAIRDLEQQIKAYARAEYMGPESIRKKANELRKQARGGDLVEKDQ